MGLLLTMLLLVFCVGGARVWGDDAAVDPHRQTDAWERGRLAMLYRAIRHLYRRGANPPAEPERSEEIALALLWIQEKGQEALAPYAGRIAGWLTHEEIAIRDLTLRCLPRPLPEVAVAHLGALLADEDEQLRITALQAVCSTGDPQFRDLVAKELRRADDTGWLMTAEAAADAVGIDVVDRMRIHARALARSAIFSGRFQVLLRIFGNRGFSSSGVPDAKERARLQAAWLRFLDAHGDAIREGRTFETTDPEVAGLIPSTVEIR